MQKLTQGRYGHSDVFSSETEVGQSWSTLPRDLHKDDTMAGPSAAEYPAFVAAAHFHGPQRRHRHWLKKGRRLHWRRGHQRGACDEGVQGRCRPADERTPSQTPLC
eukprot:1791982-Pyramimonas_sp.AAC.1